MIILTQNRKLQIVSGVANLDWVVSWQKSVVTCGIDCEPCLTNEESQGQTTVGSVDMIPIPTTNTNTQTYSNNIEYISVYNDSGSGAQITIQIDVSGTPRILALINLAIGAHLIYNEDSGWQVFDSDGAAPSPSGTTDLTDGHIFVGSALNIATDVAMSGEATIINTGAITLSNAAVIAKVLTGYVSGAGVVAATDSILQAIQKLNGNIAALVTGVSSVSGTTNRITVSPTTGAVVVDISATYVGQTSITTLGTVITGTWQGTKIGLAYGGTNADLSATGGTSFVLRQNTVGGAITVSQLGISELSGLGANVATMLGTFSSANIISACTDETGTGSLVFSSSPTLITPLLGTPTSGDLTNCIGNYFTIAFETGAISPADSTTYYFSDTRIVPNTTATNFSYNLGYAYKIIGIKLGVGINSTSGSTETSTLQVRNITQATSTSAGTFTTDGSATLIRSATFTGLNISVASGDSIALQWDSPVWALNPVGMVVFATLFCQKQ